MQQKFKVKLKEGLAIWPTFVEVCERRNLITHTGGKVSDQYLASARANRFEVTNVVLGQKLQVTPDYYRSAVDAIYEVGAKLCHVFWRKFAEDQREAADDALNMLGYPILTVHRVGLPGNTVDYTAMPHRARLLGFCFTNADFLFEMDAQGVIQFAAGAANDLVQESGDALIGCAAAKLFKPSEGTKFAAFVKLLKHGQRAGPFKLTLATGAEANLAMFRLPENGANTSYESRHATTGNPLIEDRP